MIPGSRRNADEQHQGRERVKLDLDIEQFWKDEEHAHDENCFSKSAAQAALGIRMSDECVFAELGEEGHPWGYTDPVRRYDLNCRYNEKARKIVGRALLAENRPLPPEKRPKHPVPGAIQVPEMFGGQYVFDGNTTWLRGTLEDEEALAKKLDVVEALVRDPWAFRSTMLPPGWDEMKKAAYEETGRRPGMFGGFRGPCTMATSVFGVERMLYLYYDDEALFTRFADVLGDALVAYFDLMREEAGYTADNFPHGFSFADDDSNLFTPEMYHAFGYRVLKKVFAHTSPNPEDNRYQHSDSAMGHLIPQLADFHLTGCNFGPTVTVREIRKYMPHTRIDGQLAPFTFMRNVEEDIAAEIRRDCEAARENDARGLNVTTAGSINNGSLLTSMRVVMAAIQKYGRY